jgi:hypothetical protein
MLPLDCFCLRASRRAVSTALKKKWQIMGTATGTIKELKAANTAQVFTLYIVLLKPLSAILKNFLSEN